MKDFFKQHSTALLALACFLIGGILMWAWQQPTPSPGKVLTTKEARQATREALAAQGAARAHNTRGDTATAHAAAPYAAAKQAAQHATILHAQTHALRRPVRPLVDSSPAAVDSLARFLATY